MSDPQRPRRVFRLPLRRSRIDRYVDEELEAHLAMKEDDLVAEGWDREEARREARRQFGNVAEIRRECSRIDRHREGRMRITEIVDALRLDLAFTVRQFRRSPGVGLLSVLTLALGIGAATVVFSVVHAVVLAPLPFEDPDRLLLLQEVTPQGADFSVSEPNYLDWVERQRAFSGLAGFSFGDRTLSGDGPPEQLSGTRITHGFLDVTSFPGRTSPVDPAWCSWPRASGRGASDPIPPSWAAPSGWTATPTRSSGSSPRTRHVRTRRSSHPWLRTPGPPGTIT
jgi:hypothetical protein